MKYLIILADGAADEPVAALGGKTPLEAARKPHIDRLAREGVTGRLVTVPDGFHPGSEIAHLGLLGYDIGAVFEGRGSLEAASMGVPIEDGEVAMRCNLITTTPDGRIKNHSAGNITTGEADELMAYLGRELGSDEVRLYAGVSYRHLLKVRGRIPLPDGAGTAPVSKHVRCVPPHDVPGQAWADKLPQAEAGHPEAEATASLLRRLILRSMELLPQHPVNRRRAAEGKDMATAIWPWSLGYRPSMRPLADRFPIRTGAVISAVDLIFGIGVYAGLEKVEVPGATGLYDTNYEGKAAAALEALRGRDFVFLHVEATDEAGHEGDAALKTRCVEALDSRIVRPIVEEVMTWDEPVRIALLPDHPTPCALRTHTADPVPVVVWQSKPAEGMTLRPDAVGTYSEAACQGGALGLMQGDGFIRALFGRTDGNT